MKPSTTLAQLADAALARRAALWRDADTDTGRIINGAADGVAGFVLDRFGAVLVAQLHQDRLGVPEADLRDLCARVMRHFDCRAVYRKEFPRDRSSSLRALEPELTDARPWMGEPVPPDLIVREHGLAYWVRPYDGYSTGLFLDHRDNRQRVRDRARGRRVLNAFAYTCAYGVAAGAGGAVEVAHVDVAKKALEWGKRNVQANGLSLDAQRFYCCDVLDFYRRAARQQRIFDLVILDPPTFSRAGRSTTVFQLTRDLGRLVRGVLPLLVVGGQLLLAVNHRATGVRELVDTVTAATTEAQRGAIVTDRPSLPLDFSGDPAYARSVWFQIP